MFLKSTKGFMLIEVLIAVGILAFGFIYVSRAFMNCLNAMAQVTNYSLASNLAAEKMFELQSERYINRAVTEKSQEGVFQGSPGFNFLLEVKKLEGLDLLSSVLVKVNWKEGRRTGSLAVDSYLPLRK